MCNIKLCTALHLPHNQAEFRCDRQHVHVLYRHCFLQGYTLKDFSLLFWQDCPITEQQIEAIFFKSSGFSNASIHMRVLVSNKSLLFHPALILLHLCLMTGSAGSSRQTRLLKIISICTIDLKDNLLGFFIQIWSCTCSIQFTVIPRHKGTQTGLAVLPRNEAILMYHNDTSYPSCGNIKLPMCGNIKHCKGVRAWPGQPILQLLLARKLKQLISFVMLSCGRMAA